MTAAVGGASSLSATSESEIPFSSANVKVSATGKGSEMPVDSMTR